MYTVAEKEDSQQQRPTTEKTINRQEYFIVEEAVSGDTIRLQDGRLVRYLGVKAPSRGDFLFEAARAANARLMRFQRAKIKFYDNKKDQQGRYLAFVYTPYWGYHCFVNQELLEFGYVRIDPKYTQHQYFREYLKKEKIAQEKRRGVWGKNPE
jgi:endonuclease YncB( thermonuclease family)